jgi:hypothetical protein
VQQGPDISYNPLTNKPEGYQKLSRAVQTNLEKVLFPLLLKN